MSDPTIDKCPSPFDWKAYAEWQRRHGVDISRDLRVAAERSASATFASEVARIEKPSHGTVMQRSKTTKFTQRRDFHVYARAGMPKGVK